MLALIIGLAIFLGVHAFTMARERRAALIGRLGGEGPYKGLYSLVAAVGLVLIVWGYGRYRAGGMMPLYEPPTGMRHVAMLLMLPVFPLLAATYLPGLIKAKTKHPMLTAVKFWALAHLLANGDAGSVVLFGSFLAWAVAARISAKRREGVLTKVSAAFSGSGWTRNDTIAMVVGLIAYVVFLFWLHPLLIGVPALLR
jgi:uncharacterized membrane protein